MREFWKQEIWRNFEVFFKDSENSPKLYGSYAKNHGKNQPIGKEKTSLITQDFPEHMPDSGILWRSLQNNDIHNLGHCNEEQGAPFARVYQDMERVVLDSHEEDDIGTKVRERLAGAREQTRRPRRGWCTRPRLTGGWYSRARPWSWYTRGW